MTSAIGWHQSRYNSISDDRSQKQLELLESAKLLLGVRLDSATESELRDDAVVQDGTRVGSLLQISLTFA